jgi:hypothetical protein
VLKTTLDTFMEESTQVLNSDWNISVFWGQVLFGERSFTTAILIVMLLTVLRSRPLAGGDLTQSGV